MKTHTTLLCCLLALAGPALAQSHGHGGQAPGVLVALAATPTPTRAEVRKVDKSAKKITLRHERIENLDMDGMTMVFQVKDAALLDTVKAGDQVRVTVDQIRGAYTVLTIEPIRP